MAGAGVGEGALVRASQRVQPKLLTHTDFIDRPLDLDVIVRGCRSGLLSWVGDLSLFPPASVSDASLADDPQKILLNLQVVELLLAIRELAALLTLNEQTNGKELRSRPIVESDPDDTSSDAAASSAAGGAASGSQAASSRMARSSARSSRHRAVSVGAKRRRTTRGDKNPVDVRWSDVVGSDGVIDDRVLTPLDLAHRSMVRVIRMLGRKARLHRIAALRARREGGKGFEIQVRHPSNSSGFVDWMWFATHEEAEDLVSVIDSAALEDLSYEALKEDRDYRAGAQIAVLAMRRGQHLSAWRSEDEEMQTRRDAIAKRFPDDVKAAKAAKKKLERKSEQEALVAAASAKTAERLGRRSGGDKTAAARRGKDGDGDGSSAPTGRPTQRVDGGGGRSGGGTGARSGDGKDKKDSGPRKTAMALPAAKRSNTLCRKARLCLNCREPGHAAADCTDPKVEYEA